LLPNKVRQQNFHGFDAIRDDVSHPVNPAHPSAAQLVENLVVANALVDFFAHGQNSFLPGDVRAVKSIIATRLITYDQHGIELQVRNYPPLPPVGQGFQQGYPESQKPIRGYI
jgi:hypothetical protein